MKANLFLADQKKELESVIIGEVILENKYVLIGSILSPQNFANYLEADNRIIWDTLEKMYPSIPIDLITITSKLYDWHGIDYSSVLAGYTERIASTYHIRYHAILLLELDLRIKLSKILNNQLEKSKANENFEKAGEIHQMIKYIENTKNDLFDTIQGASRYLESLGYSEEFKAVNNLISFLPDKLVKIREDSQIETCINHLSKISNMRPEFEPLLDGLIGAIKKVLQTDDINQSIINQKITELINSI